MIYKKGALQLYFIVIALFIFVGAGMYLIFVSTPELETIGETQLSLLYAYEEHDDLFQYLDIQSRISLENSIVKTSENVGFKKDEFQGLAKLDDCGELGYKVISQDCKPDHEETLELYMYRNLNFYKYHYPHPDIHNAEIESSIDGEELVLSSSNQINTPIYVDVENYIMQRGTYIIMGDLEAESTYERNENGFLEREGLLYEPNVEAPEYIILHATYTDGVNETFDQLRSSGKSYHYLVDREGEVYRFVDEGDDAYHSACSYVEGPCESYDNNSVSIALINCGREGKGCSLADEEVNGLEWEDYEEEQLESTAELLSSISSNQGIDLDRNYVLTQSDTAESLDNTGPLLDIEELLAKARDLDD